MRLRPQASGAALVALNAIELSALVKGRAEVVGRRWASDMRAAMVQENRRACGGWPGTLSEARVHVRIQLLPWLADQGEPAVTSEQREGAARLVYASARSSWMENREAEEEP